MDNISRCDNTSFPRSELRHKNFSKFPKNFGDKILYIYIYSLKIQIIFCSFGDVTEIKKWIFGRKCPIFIWIFEPLSIYSIFRSEMANFTKKSWGEISFLIENVEFSFIVPLKFHIKKFLSPKLSIFDKKTQFYGK